MTTLRLGGPATKILAPETEDDLVDVVRDLDRDRLPFLLLGQGSNLVVSDAGFPGPVVRVGHAGVAVAARDEGAVAVTVAAGEPWDDLVAWSVGEDLAGLESLSGIPGLAGATPIQNVGAYGHDVSEVIVSVRVIDRETGAVVDLDPDACAFGYRSSVFRPRRGGRDERFVAVEVTFELARRRLSGPVRYADLARALGVPEGTAGVPTRAVREAVLDLRRSKGMVLDPDDPDTASAGSFFTNPVLDVAAASTLPPDAPTWPEPFGAVKTSAAWLIERAGFSRGYTRGRVRISAKHTLALTNTGGATTGELLDLAREIRAGVDDAFGVELVPEPRLVGCSL
jgi:UDP-N-acetylmuramate dehydrogenase